MPYDTVDPGIDHPLLSFLRMPHYYRSKRVVSKTQSSDPPAQDHQEESQRRTHDSRLAHQVKAKYIKRNEDPQAHVRGEEQGHKDSIRNWLPFLKQGLQTFLENATVATVKVPYDPGTAGRSPPKRATSESCVQARRAPMRRG